MHQRLERYSLVFSLAFAAVLTALPARAQDFSDQGLEILPFVHLESHGYFRFRSDVFYRLDLANDASGFKKSLSQSGANQPLNEASSTITSSNMRFRFSPSLLVGERLKIHSTIDFLDNVVFGTSASFNYENPSEPLPFMSESQSSGGSFKDAARVKSVYLEWQLFNQFYVFAGRMPEHFGLGILKNSGECPECNFGNYSDTAGFTVKLTDIYFSTHLDFPGEGTTSDTGLYNDGQPHDAEGYDDITRWTFKVFSKPVTIEEKRARAERLSNGKVAI
ncbi:MAG: hypothetical protein FJ088_07985, partial [Deltaproteobacteria bacterium]|nr:hypothetical protein [Deltaproteobacteria bacterium]